MAIMCLRGFQTGAIRDGGSREAAVLVRGKGDTRDARWKRLGILTSL